VRPRPAAASPRSRRAVCQAGSECRLPLGDGRVHFARVPPPTGVPSMRRLLAVAVVAFAATPLLAQPKDFFFQPNDRVVFLGDSITEQYQYSSYMELYLTTRFPKGNFVFLNAGIGGDTANGGANRFQSQVLDDKPTAVTINFGMNDG